MLFDPASLDVPKQRMRETVKQQLREYSASLFEAEAKHRSRRTSDPEELRSWLDELSGEIEAEVKTIAEKRQLDYHCTQTERLQAVHDQLQSQTEQWIDRVKRKGETSSQKVPVPPIEPVGGWGDRWVNKASTAIGDTESIAERRSAKRKNFVDPVLRKKGMTPAGWAAEAGLDPSVVYDYLSGKSKPRPESRNLLAEALGVDEPELPD